MEYEFEKNKLKEYLGNDLYDILKKYNCIIAGGTICSLFTNRDINDIDVYFRNKDDIFNILIDEMSGYYVLSATRKAILLKYKDKEVQFIHFKYYKNPEEIFETFDFTVCMGVFDFKTEEFILHKDFLRHNSQRVLVYNTKTAFPIISALRIDKYKNKGYNISKLEFMKVMMTINNLKINSYKELEEQIGGMYGENYSKLFEVKTDKEFNMQEVIESICNYEHKKALEKIEKEDNSELDFSNWEVFVAKQLGEIKYFDYKDNKYAVIGNKFIELDEIEDDFIKVDMQQAIKLPLIKYKYVKKEDGKYYSFYDKNFEYKIGEKVYAKGSRGLFVLDKNKLEDSIYADKENKVVLKCLIESLDDLGDLEDLDSLDEVKALKVLEEVKED